MSEEPEWEDTMRSNGSVLCERFLRHGKCSRQPCLWVHENAGEGKVPPLCKDHMYRRGGCPRNEHCNLSHKPPKETPPHPAQDGRPNSEPNPGVSQPSKATIAVVFVGDNGNTNSIFNRAREDLWKQQKDAVIFPFAEKLRQDKRVVNRVQSVPEIHNTGLKGGVVPLNSYADSPQSGNSTAQSRHPVNQVGRRDQVVGARSMSSNVAHSSVQGDTGFQTRLVNHGGGFQRGPGTPNYSRNNESGLRGQNYPTNNGNGVQSLGPHSYSVSHEGGHRGPGLQNHPPNHGSSFRSQNYSPNQEGGFQGPGTQIYPLNQENEFRSSGAQTYPLNHGGGLRGSSPQSRLPNHDNVTRGQNYPSGNGNGFRGSNSQNYPPNQESGFWGQSHHPSNESVFRSPGSQNRLPNHGSSARCQSQLPNNGGGFQGRGFQGRGFQGRPPNQENGFQGQNRPLYNGNGPQGSNPQNHLSNHGSGSQGPGLRTPLLIQGKAPPRGPRAQNTYNHDDNSRFSGHRGHSFNGAEFPQGHRHQDYQTNHSNNLREGIVLQNRPTSHDNGAPEGPPIAGNFQNDGAVINAGTGSDPIDKANLMEALQQTANENPATSQYPNGVAELQRVIDHVPNPSATSKEPPIAHQPSSLACKVESPSALLENKSLELQREIDHVPEQLTISEESPMAQQPTNPVGSVESPGELLRNASDVATNVSQEPIKVTSQRQEHFEPGVSVTPGDPGGDKGGQEASRPVLENGTAYIAPSQGNSSPKSEVKDEGVALNDPPRKSHTQRSRVEKEPDIQRVFIRGMRRAVHREGPNSRGSVDSSRSDPSNSQSPDSEEFIGTSKSHIHLPIHQNEFLKNSDNLGISHDLEKLIRRNEDSTNGALVRSTSDQKPMVHQTSTAGSIKARRSNKIKDTQGGARISDIEHEGGGAKLPVEQSVQSECSSSGINADKVACNRALASNVAQGGLNRPKNTVQSGDNPTHQASKWDTKSVTNHRSQDELYQVVYGRQFHMRTRVSPNPVHEPQSQLPLQFVGEGRNSKSPYLSSVKEDKPPTLLHYSCESSNSETDYEYIDQISERPYTPEPEEEQADADWGISRRENDKKRIDAKASGKVWGAPMDYRDFNRSGDNHLAINMQTPGQFSKTEKSLSKTTSPPFATPPPVAGKSFAEAAAPPSLLPTPPPPPPLSPPHPHPIVRKPPANTATPFILSPYPPPSKSTKMLSKKEPLQVPVEPSKKTSSPGPQRDPCWHCKSYHQQSDCDGTEIPEKPSKGWARVIEKSDDWDWKAGGNGELKGWSEDVSTPTVAVIHAVESTSRKGQNKSKQTLKEVRVAKSLQNQDNSGAEQAKRRSKGEIVQPTKSTLKKKGGKSASKKSSCNGKVERAELASEDTHQAQKPNRLGSMIAGTNRTRISRSNDSESGRLPKEILHMVFSYVADGLLPEDQMKTKNVHIGSNFRLDPTFTTTRYRRLKAVLHTCRLWYQLGQEIIYKYINLDQFQSFKGFVKTVSEDAQLGRIVCAIKLNIQGGASYTTHDNRLLKGELSEMPKASDSAQLFTKMMESCPELQILSASMHGAIRGFNLVLTKFPMMREMQIMDDSSKGMVANNLWKTLNNFPNLEKFKIFHSRDNGATNFDSLRIPPKMFPNKGVVPCTLKALTMERAPELSDKILGSFAQRLTQLTTLVIVDCKLVTSAGLARAIQRMPDPSQMTRLIYYVWVDPYGKATPEEMASQKDHLCSTIRDYCQNLSYLNWKPYRICGEFWKESNFHSLKRCRIEPMVFKDCDKDVELRNHVKFMEAYRQARQEERFPELKEDRVVFDFSLSPETLPLQA